MNKTTRRGGALVACAAHATCAIGANLLAAKLPPLPVLPGVVAPAGVLLVGLSLAARDWVHETAGSRVALVLVPVSACASLPFVPAALAGASLAAFVVSELLDQVVYARLRSRGLVVALAASNACGLVLDSFVFLALAPSFLIGANNLALLPGQIVGKAWATLAVVLALFLRRAMLRRKLRAIATEGPRLHGFAQKPIAPIEYVEHEQWEYTDGANGYYKTVMVKVPPSAKK